ncbi:MAG: di-trans,poly-cis-decaprenylcistransferase, partial [Clostridia bacterium]|nr:di-trans,poly-cis-decaprenylcistransferase [Clostridia bacterium]
MIKKSKSGEERPPIHHIAFIMDGNGRWAKKRGMPREYGHRFGVKTFRSILEHCHKSGIEIATFYAFSTENWKRPKKEVDAIMKLMDRYFEECEKNIEKYDFAIRFLGDKSVFDDARRARMERLEEQSKDRVQKVNI